VSTAVVVMYQKRSEKSQMVFISVSMIMHVLERCRENEREPVFFGLVARELRENKFMKL
jgi:ribosomal protein L14